MSAAPVHRAGDRASTTAVRRDAVRPTSQQFDATVHIDQTRGVEPLDRSVAGERGEPPETDPTAL